MTFFENRFESYFKILKNYFPQYERGLEEKQDPVEERSKDSIEALFADYLNASNYELLEKPRSREENLLEGMQFMQSFYQRWKYFSGLETALTEEGFLELQDLHDSAMQSLDNYM
ncbi:MAG: hypothetical protein Q4B50_07870, partial [Bacillota bacterium]|nr:hypothetical protein [Bacillota bacterium]